MSTDRIRFSVVFKQGLKVIHSIIGPPIPASSLTAEDVAMNIITVERMLEKLLGLRVHIEGNFVDEADDETDA